MFDSWKKNIWRISLAIILCLSCAQAADVLTQRNDNFRSGLNLAETLLNPQSLRQPGIFGKLYTRNLDANAYAQPLYVSQVEVSGRRRDVIFVATENNTVYAFADDASDKNPDQEPLWKVNLGPAIPTEELSADIGDSPSGCADLTTRIGITSTPVIDRSNLVLYAVTKTKKDGHYVHTLNALDIRTGALLRSIVIQGTVPGRGIGSDSSGQITFQPAIQVNRPGLLLDHGRLYIAFGGHCDVADFHGWLFAYDATTFKQLNVFATTPNTIGKFNGQGGIWQSGGGPAADEEGNVYLTVGNGGYDTALKDFGDTVLKLQMLNGKFNVTGWFSPTNEEVLKIQDADLGSTGALIIPGTPLLVIGSKEGKLYLLNRLKMKEKISALQEVQVTPIPHYFGPATDYGSIRYWNIHGTPLHFQSAAGRYLYVCGEEDPVRVFRLSATNADGDFRLDSSEAFATSDERAAYPPQRSQLANPPVAEPAVWMPGGFLCLTANSNIPNTAVLWAFMPLSGNANGRVVRSVLRAFDPINFQTRPDGSRRMEQIWSSDHNGNQTADALGMYAKFATPTVANGRVIVTTFNEETVGTNGVHVIKNGGLKASMVVYGLRSRQ